MGFHEPFRYKALLQALIWLLVLLPVANADIQYGQEDPGLYVLPEYPILPTDQPIDPGPELMLPGLAKANTVIAINYYGLFGELNITNFDVEWLAFLNETNLTA